MYPELTLEVLDKILQKRFKEGFLSLKDLPHPNTFRDMQKATERIVRAIKEGEKIIIIGDYDVDGVTSTVMMKLFFDEIGTPVEWIIPNRFRDGYGLSSGIVSRIKGTDLAITVDNGIAAVEAAQCCKKEGIALIITDHHTVPSEIPEAYAIINQKQKECTFPYEEVCGAQIAWYLIASLKNALGITINMMAYMEFATIAIIADIMPLRHINRAMVIAGTQALSKSTKPAIRAYLEYTQKQTLTSEDIAFGLAPILNASGRMKDASYAVDFLSSTTLPEAKIRLEKLIAFNTLRKETEEEMTQKALAQVELHAPVILVKGKGWHEGVLGIVAARLARLCEKPSIVLTQNENGMLKGSGRSYGEYNLFAKVNSAREYLERFGGHQAAIGLSLHETAFKSFKEALFSSSSEEIQQMEHKDPELIGILHFSQISFELTALMKKYEPFGQGNPRPKFISTDVEIVQVASMGKNGEHTRFSFVQEGIVLPAVHFRNSDSFHIGEKVEIHYTINENHFRGKVSLQLMLDKVRRSG